MRSPSERDERICRVETVMNRVVLCAWIAVLGLAGCSSPEEDIQAWMNEQASKYKGNVKPLPEIVPAETVAYVGYDFADPFRPAVVPDLTTQAPRGEFRPDLTRRREPLEAYALETLAFVGTLERGSETVALIRADKSLYQVKPGNYMGQDFGMVTAVSDSELTLKELVEDLNGEWGERVTTLQLQEQQNREAAKK